MKIIEQGKFNKEWTIRHRCTGWGHDGHGCDALLEVEKSDLRYRPSESEDRDSTVSFKCACCGALTAIGMVDWPKDYRKLARYTKDWEHCEGTPI